MNDAHKELALMRILAELTPSELRRALGGATKKSRDELKRLKKLGENQAAESEEFYYLQHVTKVFSEESA